jgi:hypothetical protein
VGQGAGNHGKMRDMRRRDDGSGLLGIVSKLHGRRYASLGERAGDGRWDKGQKQHRRSYASRLQAWEPRAA